MKVSVVIPAYNVQATVKKAIDSALCQDFLQKDFEIIVVNDGSTDKTAEILKGYRDQIRVINQKNQGTVKAANIGFKNSKGKYVIKLDTDDSFEPTILKEMISVLERRPSIDFVYSDYYEKDITGKIKIVSTKNNLFNTVAIGIMYRKDKLAQYDFYNENIIFAEYDLLLRTLGRWQGYHIKTPLFWYNRRKESLSQNKKLVRAGLAQLKKCYPERIKEIKKIRKY